jgi:calcineurin-like phosphoesterase
MNILFIADIVGEDVIDIILDILPRLRNRHHIDFTIANVENTDKGKGILARQIEKLKANGIDCLTSGNHIWEPRKRDVLIDYAGYILRPLNYPEGNVGIGSTIITSKNNKKVAVLNLQGRSFMYPIECPFNTVQKEIKRLRSETPIIFLDFHAETTAEKQAMGWYLKGTAYITDAGMCGPFDSVIGMDTKKAIDRFLLQTHIYYSIAKENLRFNGVVIELEENSGSAQNITRLNFSKQEFDKDAQNH